MPHLSRSGHRDGLAAWAYLPDQSGRGRTPDDDPQVRRAHVSVSRLPSLRDGVSVARAVRRLDGKGAWSDRAPAAASLARAGAAAGDIPGTFSASPAYGVALCRAALVPAPGRASPGAAAGHYRSLPRVAQAHGSAAASS